MKQKITVLMILIALTIPVAANTTIKQFQLSNQCKTVVFQLPANPTTGYSWTVLDYNQARFKKKKARFESPKSERIGAGGKMLFTFTLREGYGLNKPAVFLLSYGQAWNKDSSEKTMVVIEFVDKPC